MNSLQGLALRLFRANKFIVFSSFLSIAIAVSLVITMVMYTTNAKETLRDEVKEIYGDMDLSVGYSVQDKFIAKSLLDQISSNTQIQQISKVFVTHLTVNQLGAEIYTVGVENNELAKSRYHFEQSLDNQSVIVNEGLAKALKINVGQKILIENKSYSLVEIIKDLSATGIAPDMLIVANETAKDYVSLKTSNNAEATYLLIKAKDSNDSVSLANQFKEHDSELRIDIAEEDEFLISNLNSLAVFLTILSVLVLLVTSLLIISNFELLLYKNKNQFAIMRSLGATTKQMSKIILIQSSIINVVGVACGLLLTIFTQRFVYHWMEALFSFTASSKNFDVVLAIIISICCSVLIQIFFLIPSYRSSKVLPLKIMEENEKLDFGHRKLRTWFGKLLIGISLFLIVFSKVMPEAEQNGVFFLLFAAVLIIVGLFTIFPVYLPILLQWLLPFIQKVFGNESYVAIKNVIPQVRKNTFVILTISALLIITVFGSVMLKTIQSNQTNQIKEQFPTPIVLVSHLGVDSAVNPNEISELVEHIPTVQNVSTVSNITIAELKTEQGFNTISYVLGDLEKLEKQGILPNLINDDVRDMMVVSEEFARKNQLQLGDVVGLGLYSEVMQGVEIKGSVHIGGISKQITPTEVVYLDWTNTAFNTEFTGFNTLFVNSTNERLTLSQLEFVTDHYPEIQINGYEQSLKESEQMFYQRWSIFIVVLVVLVLSIMVGVFNTLANNIFSKRKEFAILRAISVNPMGLNKIVLTQVLLYIFIGITIGIIVGLVLSFVLSLIDPSPLKINFSVILIISSTLIVSSVLVFVLVSIKIGKQSISLELTRDNK